MSTQYLFEADIEAALLELQIDRAKLQVQTQIMDQSLAVMLRQLCYGKISFIVLIPDRWDGNRAAADVGELSPARRALWHDEHAATRDP